MVNYSIITSLEFGVRVSEVDSIDSFLPSSGFVVCLDITVNVSFSESGLLVSVSDFIPAPFSRSTGTLRVLVLDFRIGQGIQCSIVDAKKDTMR